MKKLYLVIAMLSLYAPTVFSHQSPLHPILSTVLTGTVRSTWEATAYNITATAGANGSITPNGITSVTSSSSKTYTITPAPCYKIATILVDGVNNAAAVACGTYTFVNVTAVHTISATFVANGGSLAAPAAITGDTANLCSAKTISYSARAVSGATSYNWAVPSGFTIISGQGTQTLTIKTPVTFTIAQLKVAASSSCKTSPQKSITLHGAPGDLSAQMTGPSQVVIGSTNVYSLPLIPKLIYVSWMADGGSFVGGWGTNIASIRAGAMNGYVKATVKNACGTGPIAKKYFTVKPAGCTAPMLSAAINNIKCLGSSSGSINLTVTNGNGPYTYKWTGPNGFIDSTEDLLYVTAGSYTVVVTAAGGCTSTATYKVTQPASFIAIQITAGTIPCNGATTTNVTVGAIGGTPPYTGTGIYYNQTAGLHTYQVTDANGCTSIDNYFIPPGSVGAPASIDGPTTNLCGGKEVTYMVSDVTTAFNYHWTVPPGFTVLDDQGSFVIRLRTPATFTTAQLKVSAVTACGASPATSLTLSGAPGDLSAEMTGPSQVVTGSVNVYSLPLIPGLIYVSWMADGGSFVGGWGTNNASIKAGAMNGYVKATVKNACGTGPIAKKFFTVQPASAQSLSDNSEINLSEPSFRTYPNPVQDAVTVVFNAKEKDTRYELRVVDIYGQVLMERKGLTNAGLNMMQLHLGKYAKGIYMLNLLTEGKINTTRLFKSN